LPPELLAYSKIIIESLVKLSSIGLILICKEISFEIYNDNLYDSAVNVVVSHYSDSILTQLRGLLAIENYQIWNCLKCDIK